MNAMLPDISVTDTAPLSGPLQWVGMQGIDLPITIAEADYRRELHASADAQVNLPNPHIKGIHMSRLYHLLAQISNGEPLTATALHTVLTAMIDSHHDCGSNNARVLLQFELLVLRPALHSQHLSGWKSYPVSLEARLQNDQFRLTAEIRIGYSSTCPCSAALSRQLVEQGFIDTFGHQQHIDLTTAASWIRANATLATPHSQRSEAIIKVELPMDSADLGLLSLVDQVEKAVGTPLQTAVKRVDEQAFAELNGQNLMFVEDAARAIQAALANHYQRPRVQVRHLESLHPHDAVAWSDDSIATGMPASL
jgi:GTP cyclohydrolase I